MKTKIGGLIAILFSLIFKSGSAQIGDYSVQLDVASPEGAHNTLVYFEDSLPWTTEVPTFGWDACCDALFIPGSTVLSFLFTEITEPVFPTNNQLSINGMPPLTGSYSVPLNLLVGTSGEHVIIAELNDIPNGMTVELQDLHLATITNLLDTNLYYFDATAGDAVDRFILHFNMNLVEVKALEKDRWSVYPTISGDAINVNGFGSEEVMKAEVLSLDGCVYKEINLTRDQTRISLSGVSAGMYVLRLSTKSQSRSFRIIKH